MVHVKDIQQQRDFICIRCVPFLLLSLSALLTHKCSELQSAASLGQSLKLHKHGGHSSEETQSRATPLLQR